jgi:hypothetical protein
LAVGALALGGMVHEPDGRTVLGQSLQRQQAEALESGAT